MPYTAFGTWSNGGAPGISSAFLNALESFLVLINSAATDANVSSDGSGNQTLVSLIAAGNLQINTAASTLSGSTAGTLTLYEPLRGSALKAALVYFSGFRNNGGSTQTLALPTAFVARSRLWCGDLPSTGIQLTSSGSAVNIAVVTALASTGGTATNVSTLKAVSTGEVLSAFDTISIPSGGSGTTDSFLLIVGR